jgi:hypothetical protein
MTPKQREDAAIYVAWLRSDRDLSPEVPIRADIARFLARLAKLEAGAGRKETAIRRYARRQERMPWIRRVLEMQRDLRRQGERRHFERALELVASEAGAPPAGTLRNWVRRDRGNSRFLPMFDDGTPNVDPEQI